MSKEEEEHVRFHKILPFLLSCLCGGNNNAVKFKPEEENISEGESSPSPSPVDIISSLHDSVLSHILSFLPTTKEAAATCILSKRWRYVWTCVDNLKFDTEKLYGDEAKEQLFLSVYKVLKLHQGAIKDFTLTGSGFDELDVNGWINTAISRGVERLHLGISFHHAKTPKWPLSMPLSVFSCKTLVDLVMWDSYRISMDIIPTTPMFPCLKKLEVPYCKNEFFMHVVPRCSALEHLIVSYADTPIHVVSSSMKRLELCYNPRNDQKLVLCVPSLQCFKFTRTFLPLELVVEEQLSSLIQAHIIFFIPYCKIRDINVKDIGDSFLRFIKHFSNVKSLRIQSRYLTTFYNSVGNVTFINLTKLEIVSSVVAWRLLLSFMEHSVNLEAISLKKIFLKNHKLDWEEPTKVPTSLSASLKKISIDGYGEEELPMVKYFLRTAQILEQVDLRCAERYINNNDWKSDMLQNLQNLYRACERCEIFLV